MKTVSIFEFKEKELDNIVSKGFEQIGLEKALRNAKLVCLKPNLVTDVKEYIKNGANTDIRIIESVLKYLTKFDCKVFIAEADSGTNVKGRKLDVALEVMGVYDLKKKYNFEIINLSNENQIEVEIPGAKFLKKIKLSEIILDADLIIDLPKIKTHKYATITCAIKNMFGTIPDPMRIIYHENIHQTLSDLNRLYMNKTYVLTDGIVAMEGKGPIYGKPVNLNILLFANSMYCNDLVACRIMKIPTKEVLHLELVKKWLTKEERNFTLREQISIKKIAKQFEPSKKNLYVAIEGKLMQHRSIVKIVYNEWIQRNFTYHFRNILKRVRGGSSSWYIDKPKRVKNKYFLVRIRMINWRKPLIYILSFLQGSKRMEYYHQVLKYDKMSDEELKDLQIKKLSKLLLHAYENVPYYKKVLKEAGVMSKGDVNLDNFEKIPILTKEILRREYKNLKSKDIDSRNSFINHSGGSTGEPVKFIQDREYDDWNVGNKMFYKKKGGVELGEKELRLWGSERDFYGDKESSKIRFRNFIFNRKDLNAFTMTEENMFKYVETVNKYKPKWIEAYVQPIYEFALFIKKNNLEVFSPNGIITSAGTLYPDMQEVISEVFNTKVWNRYGSREVGDMAFGIRDLKLSTWNHFVEVNESKNSDLGPILVTTLNNYSMPLIRYDIGDIAIQSSKWNFLERVEGRETTVIRNKEGKIIPSELFIHFLGVVMNEGVIKQFQLIQNDYEKITIKVVVLDGKSFKKSIPKLEELINKAIGYKCKIDWVKVDEIPKLKSGKYLYIKSMVS